PPDSPTRGPPAATNTVVVRPSPSDPAALTVERMPTQASRTATPTTTTAASGAPAAPPAKTVTQ
ncbi:MAG TPA: hypothetical protein DIW53_26870, partial [Achromobacter sp.]|nr:hypothetical protein [Achromobacter sp.]